MTLLQTQFHVCCTRHQITDLNTSCGNMMIVMVIVWNPACEEAFYICSQAGLEMTLYVPPSDHTSVTSLIYSASLVLFVGSCCIHRSKGCLFARLFDVHPLPWLLTLLTQAHSQAHLNRPGNEAKN